MKVQTGLDRLHEADALLRGRRVGLMTNQTGVDGRLRAGIDIIQAAYGLAALFACEHGVRGDLQAGAALEGYVDARTGVPVHSCYGAAKRPTDAMLDGIDVFVFDMQDAGSRFYTYLYSLAFAMEACAARSIPVVVLDRPNPLGGLAVQGTLLDEAFASFVGMYAIPTRYGLTIGEYARFVRDHLGLALDLTVVPMEGWTRGMYYADTGLAWVAPSPNLPTPQTAVAYGGTCIFEGTNLSEGRGTTQPFELIGAPWADAPALADALNALDMPGVRFRPAHFTPAFSKHAGVPCQGVQLHVTDRRAANPFAAGLYMAQTIRAMYPDDFAFIPWDGGRLGIDLLLGGDAFSSGRMDARTLIDASAPLACDFQRRARGYWLYE